jgi:hypothetical protein
MSNEDENDDTREWIDLKPNRTEGFGGEFRLPILTARELGEARRQMRPILAEFARDHRGGETVNEEDRAAAQHFSEMPQLWTFRYSVALLIEFAALLARNTLLGMRGYHEWFNDAPAEERQDVARRLCHVESQHWPPASE